MATSPGKINGMWESQSQIYVVFAPEMHHIVSKPLQSLYRIKFADPSCLRIQVIASAMRLYCDSHLYKEKTAHMTHQLRRLCCKDCVVWISEMMKNSLEVIISYIIGSHPALSSVTCVPS